MKVKCEFVVDIDTESWTMNYGIEGVKEIRADVKMYVENGIKDHMRDLGLLTEES